jgi:hypothetical protein
LNAQAVRAPALDARLIGVDRLATRWAKDEQGTRKLHPLEAIRLLHDGAVLGGGPIPTPADIIKFDDCHRQSPPHDRAVIHIWYRTHAVAQVKADRLGVSRASLYIEWKNSLAYYRGWLRANGLDI